MDVVKIILTVLEVIASVALIGVVLLQSGKNPGIRYQVDRSGLDCADSVPQLLPRLIK